MGSATFLEVEAPRRVAVRGPVATIDRDPAGFAALVERVGRGYELSASGVLTLPGGRFHLPSGIVSVSGLFPDEAIPLDGFPYSWQLTPSLKTLWSPATTVPDGYLVSPQLSHGYYHWVCEVLPLALLCAESDESGTLPLYVGAELPPFVSSYLELVGLGARIVPLGSGVYRCNRLRVPVFPGGAEWPSPDHLLATRRRVLDALGPAPRRRHRLLITRQDAVDRRLVNEDELLGCPSLGLERISLDGMTVREQVSSFRDAELIVSPHGAGLANMLFAPSDCRVVELVGAKHFSACYMVIASVLGQPYAYVAASHRGRDLSVDVSDVRNVIESLEAVEENDVAR